MIVIRTVFHQLLYSAKISTTIKLVFLGTKFIKNSIQCTHRLSVKSSLRQHTCLFTGKINKKLTCTSLYAIWTTIRDAISMQ